ncbi:MAG: methyltransferase [Bacteroidales bacterium]|nr:methyltransferase [Bacteroidales bacterium]
MSNSYFQFKQFIVNQDKSAFKVGTDGVLLGACASVNKVSHILDIGTGTGLIALMAAQRSNATVFAVEPDKDSYQQACENFRNSKWSNRINAFNGRIQDFNVDFRFNLILSNPPYFVNSLKIPI